MSDDQERSYKTRGRAAPHNHMVYQKYLEALNLDASDDQDLKSRGLKSEQIGAAGYKTKPSNRSTKAAEALAHLISAKINLEGVPGFFKNEAGHWDQAGMFGLVIPVTDIEGHTASLLLKNAKPKEKAGRAINKYIAFSSAGRDMGGKVWQTTHCPYIKGDPRVWASTTIRITEGVLKADIATAVGSLYTIGLQGLKIHDDLETILEALEVATVEICLDSGEDDNPDMMQIKSKLIKRLRRFGVDVLVAKWDPKLGKGIDDLIVAGHESTVKHMSDEEVDYLLEASAERDPFSGDWIYCIATERFYHIHDYECLKKSQFADYFHIPKMQDVNDLLASGFPQVNTLAFRPAKGKVMREGRISMLNLWKDPKIIPKEGCIDVFLNHLHFLFPRSKKEVEAGQEFSLEANIILDWMAFQVQFPGVKINWALLIKGAEGVGKSAFEAIMGRLLGADNVREVTNEEIGEKYTDWMESSSLIIVHELMSFGRMETMNKIKPLITQATVQIRRMHTPTYTTTNLANFLLFTNHGDAIPISKGDRRYAVLWTEAKLFPDEKDQVAYYQPLWDWIKSEDMASNLIFHLKARDISNFNPKTSAPMTKSKKEAIRINRNSLEEWMAGCIEDKAWPFEGDIVSIRHLKDRRVCPHGFERVSDYKWAEALRSCGGEPNSVPTQLSNGSSARLWVVRRPEIHLSAKNNQDHFRKHFESYSLDVEPGGNPLADGAPM